MRLFERLIKVKSYTRYEISAESQYDNVFDNLCRSVREARWLAV